MKAAEEKKTKRADRGNSDGNVLRVYFNEISRIPLLTREEENAVAKAAARGDTAARNKLINSNLRFVVSVAKKYQGRGILLADIINEGNLGLINAAERFDVSRGYHFISYAVWWIRESILKTLYEKSRLIRLPVNQINDLIHIENARKSLGNCGNPENEIQEIAQMLNMEKNYVMDIMSISREVISLERLLKNDKGPSSLGDFVVDERYDAPEQAVIKKFLADDIEELLGTLDSREAEIIRLRFGLGKHPPMSLQKIGEYFNLTKERVRQIEEKALIRLRHLSRKVKLAPYVA